MHLVLLVVLVGGDLVGKHAAAGHVGLGVVDIGDDLDRRVVEAALLRLIVVVGLRLRRLERGCSLRVGSASRRDRGGVGAGRAAVAEARRRDGPAHVANVLLGSSTARSGVASRRRRAGVSGAGSRELLLASLLLAVSHLAGVSLGDLMAEGLEEVVEVAVEVLLSNSQVPLEKEEKLLLHEVDLGAAEAKVVAVSGDVAVVGPVLVLGRAVVEVLGGEDESSEEDSVGGTSQASGHGLKLGLEAAKVDEGRHEGGDLDVGRDDELSDELLKSRKAAIFGSNGPGLGAPGRSREVMSGVDGSGRHEGRVAGNDVVGGFGKIGDHVATHRLVDELLEGNLVELLHGEVPC